ncbi:MAG TPA: DUF1835 domain-containing protein, partial [Gemmatimonadaceae bacterium]|nr:DUF1835 domain-containing protein [Gemmatimonadaceae bacterium]
GRRTARQASSVTSILNITNGDCAGDGMRAAEIPGDILPWRDILHEGPVPAGLPLDELSKVRSRYIAAGGMGDLAEVEQNFAERDDALRRFTDHDEVILWFEWDLYDQLQLLQILDFMSGYSREYLAETNTRLRIISLAGYLGMLPADAFRPLFQARVEVTDEMLQLGQRAWEAFRAPSPIGISDIIHGDTTALPFLAGALSRHLEEFPSVRNGLSRSESHLLESIARGPVTFSDAFESVANREERIFCGDATVAGYLERLSAVDEPLVVFPSGERITAPRTEEDSAAFRNAQLALTPAGRAVLQCDRDWINMGGSDRWLGGVHLAGSDAAWRWDDDARELRPSNGGAAPE